MPLRLKSVSPFNLPAPKFSTKMFGGRKHAPLPYALKFCAHKTYSHLIRLISTGGQKTRVHIVVVVVVAVVVDIVRIIGIGRRATTKPIYEAKNSTPLISHSCSLFVPCTLLFLNFSKIGQKCKAQIFFCTYFELDLSRSLFIHFARSIFTALPFLAICSYCLNKIHSFSYASMAKYSSSLSDNDACF